MGRYNPKELSPLHLRALRLLSEGISVREVARLVGRSESQITHVKRSEMGVRYMALLRFEQERFHERSGLVRGLVEQGYIRL